MLLSLEDIHVKWYSEDISSFILLDFRIYEQAGKYSTHKIISRVAKVVKMGSSFLLEVIIYLDRVHDY